MNRKLIARQDGSRSRTKATNIAALVSAALIAIPAFSGLLPAWVYSVLLAGFAAAQQYFRDTQTKL